MLDRIAHLLPLAERQYARHEKAMKKLHDQAAAIQRECPHAKTTHHPDAAGGYDSETHCSECGAYQGRGVKWIERPSIIGGYWRR